VAGAATPSPASARRISCGPLRAQDHASLAQAILSDTHIKSFRPNTPGFKGFADVGKRMLKQAAKDQTLSASTRRLIACAELWSPVPPIFLTLAPATKKNPRFGDEVKGILQRLRAVAAQPKTTVVDFEAPFRAKMFAPLESLAATDIGIVETGLASIYSPDQTYSLAVAVARSESPTLAEPVPDSARVKIKRGLGKFLKGVAYWDLGTSLLAASYRYEIDPACPAVPNPATFGSTRRDRQCIVDITQSGIGAALPTSIAVLKGGFDNAVKAVKEAQKHSK
jgi:hypothetical protein